MKKCIITITTLGYALGKRILEKDPTYDLFTLEKYSDNKRHSIKSQLRLFIENNFDNYDSFIFIMATGIVIRLIKDLIQDKLTDPGILVMDLKGKFVISLLSGHIGQANAEAVRIAHLMKATPIITTASDTMKTISVDLFAKRHACQIVNYNQAKKITACIVNQESVNINTQWPINEKLPSNITYDTLDSNYKGTLIITNKSLPFHKNKVRLFMKTLIVSMGCKRNTSSEAILEFITESFSKNDLSVHSIKKLVSIDLKKKEQGFIKASKALHVPFETITKKAVEKIENNFKGSAFVKKSIGVSCVSEPCGFIASNNGQQLIKKKSKNGMTLSVWEVING